MKNNGSFYKATWFRVTGVLFIFVTLSQFAVLSLIVFRIQQNKPENLVDQLVFAAIFFGIITLLAFIFSAVVIARMLKPIQEITKAMNDAAGGNFDVTIKAPVHEANADELGLLTLNFNQFTGTLKEKFLSLENSISDRTIALELRSSRLQTAAEIGQKAALFRDLQTLLTETTSMISNGFGFYHVGIFLNDVRSEYAVLRAANSEGGQKMLGRNHMLRIGQTGIVGNVAETGKPRIALDVGQDAIFFNNPDLPQTRSEMALPLMVFSQTEESARIIGVLDVQSTVANAFSQEDVTVLQLLADQIALAIENARLFEESKTAYQELNILYNERIRQSWQERLSGRKISYYYDRDKVQSAQEMSAETLNEGDRVLNIPIRLHIPGSEEGVKLGEIILRRAESQPAWNMQERVLVQDVINQIVPALDNARLLEEIQQTAQMEAIVSQITTHLTESLELDQLMQKAVLEIANAVDASRVRLKLESALQDSMEGKKAVSLDEEISLRKNGSSGGKG